LHRNSFPALTFFFEMRLRHLPGEDPLGVFRFQRPDARAGFVERRSSSL
jgi:hypothetical protein